MEQFNLYHNTTDTLLEDYFISDVGFYDDIMVYFYFFIYFFMNVSETFLELFCFCIVWI